MTKRQTAQEKMGAVVDEIANSPEFLRDMLMAADRKLAAVAKVLEKPYFPQGKIGKGREMVYVDDIREALGTP